MLRMGAMNVLRPPLLMAALLGAAAAQAQLRCLDEDSPSVAAAAAAAQPAAPEAPPRERLSTMVRNALERSHAVGASTLLAEAALSDIEETRAARELQSSLVVDIAREAERTGSTVSGPSLRVGGTLQASVLLYDGGRTRRLVDWRTELADAARYGQINTQEQVAAGTVALALERSRFRQQATVYGQYVRKMTCLAQALEVIVAADRGRSSELVQARKSLQTAELAQAQALSQVRQVEVRLRRIVGQDLPSPEGLATALLEVPPLDLALLEAERSPQIAQLTAQSLAADRFAQSVELASRPRLNWTFNGSATDHMGGLNPPARAVSAGFGLNLNIPLYNPGVVHASDSAQKRARAAFMQRDDALESRRQRVADAHEQTVAALDRARRVSAVLRDSDQLRNFTLQQWQQLGRRSLFDVMSAEAEHYNLRVQYVNALHDGQQLNVVLQSLGRGVVEWLR